MLDKKSQMADYPPPSYRFPVSESDFLGFPFLPFRSDFFAKFPKNGGALLRGVNSSHSAKSSMGARVLIICTHAPMESECVRV